MQLFVELSLNFIKIAYNFASFENFLIFISVPLLEIEQGRK